MRFKYNIFCLIIIFALIFSISSASASDVDDVIGSPQDDSISDISLTNDIGTEDSGDIALEEENSAISSDERSDESSKSFMSGSNDLSNGDSTYSISDLIDKINNAEGELVEINGTYVWNDEKDSAYKDGFQINKNSDFHIKASYGTVIDGKNNAIFNFTGSHKLNITNLRLINSLFNNYADVEMHITINNSVINNYNASLDFSGVAYSSTIGNDYGNLTGSISIYDSDFRNTGGNVSFKSNYFKNVSVINENGIFSMYSGNIYNSNFTNDNGNVFGRSVSFYDGNFENNYGNIAFGEIYTYMNGDKEVKARSYPYFYNSNFTNNGGNVSYLAGYSSYSCFINKYGNFDAGIAIYNTSDSYGENSTSASYASFEYSNFTNVGGNFTSAATRFSNINIINDNGNFNISAVNYEKFDGNRSFFTYITPTFSGGNISNLNGNFSSQSGYFGYLNLENDKGNFEILNYTYSYINGSGENVSYSPSSHIGNNNITNKGNFSAVSTFGQNNLANDGDIIINSRENDYNNVTNYGNAIFKGNEVSKNKIHNFGNFNISNENYGIMYLYTNDMENYGNFLVHGNCSCGNYDSTNISNYGNFSFDGENETLNISSYSISNEGTLKLTGALYENGILANDGIVKSVGTVFGGNISNIGQFDSLNDTYNGTYISNSGDYAITGSSLYDVDLLNEGSVNLAGKNEISNSNLTGGNLTNDGNMDLYDSKLSGIELYNKGRLNVDGGLAENLKVYSEGNVSSKNSNISSFTSNFDSIIAENISTYYGSGVLFTAVFTDAKGEKLAKKSLNFNVNGKDYAVVTDLNGFARLNRQFSVGKYDILLVNPLTSKSKRFALIVDKAPAKITAKGLTENYGARKYFTIKVADNKGKALGGIKFSIKLNKKTYTALSKSNGVVKLKLPVLKVGTYKVIVSGNSNSYKIPSKKIVIRVNKAKTTVKAPKITSKYRKSKYFKLRVKSKVTKKAVGKIKIKVKVYTGKKYRAYKIRTDKKGVAKINVKSLKKGSHKVVITSLNRNYIISKKSRILIK